ncbi:hypothetical protein CDO73_06430 [Saccharibacillus sp. O23]|nr:hypothetical protein CDO73_06430 [Saccharibacillus sp. O23]
MDNSDRTKTNRESRRAKIEGADPEDRKRGSGSGEQEKREKGKGPNSEPIKPNRKREQERLQPARLSGTERNGVNTEIRTGATERTPKEGEDEEARPTKRGRRDKMDSAAKTERFFR